MPPEQPAIHVRNLGKKYRLGSLAEKNSTFRETISHSFKFPFQQRKSLDFSEIWALRDVSFEVGQGEVVGIIGRNGAGKSTLLKILSRITTPSEGTIELYGRVGSLLEVGTGFHPELSGMENIFLSGSILGMKRREIENKLDEIVKFSDIEKFLNTPVKRYSSGMYVRLAFSVAAYMEPEILLVDEVLAVGDAAFQRKCLGKMHDVAREGRTVLFVSHNMAAISQLCSRVIVLKDGEIKSDGSPNQMIDNYLHESLLFCNTGQNMCQLKTADEQIILESFQIFGESGQEILKIGRPWHIRINFNFLKPLNNPGFIISIRSSQSIPLMYFSTYPISGIDSGICFGPTTCTLTFDELLLTEGSYILAVGLSQPKIEYLLPVTEIGQVHVPPGNYYNTGSNQSNNECFFLQRHSWNIGHELLIDNGI